MCMSPPTQLMYVVAVLLLLPQGLRTGSREVIKVRPQAMLEAKDLPPNHLSAILEQKVTAALAADRQQRAMMQVSTRDTWMLPG